MKKLGKLLIVSFCLSMLYNSVGCSFSNNPPDNLEGSDKIVEISDEEVNSFDEKYITIFGRSYVNNGALALEHAANAVEVGIIGTSLKVNLTTSAPSYMRVWVDGVEQPERITINSTKMEYTVADNLENGYHTIRMVKATEMQDARWSILSFDAEKFAIPPKKFDLKIEFVGDSITAGYGVLGPGNTARTIDNSDATKTYAYKTASLLNADYSVVAWSGICTKAYYWTRSINMDDLYVYTTYMNKVEYAFDFQPDVVVVNLGTNDWGYMSAVDTSYKLKFSTDYINFLSTIRDRNPNAHIICLYGMMGTSSVVDKGISEAVAFHEDEKIVYNPISILENYGGAGGHPNMESQQIWAELLAEYINTLDL